MIASIGRFGIRATWKPLEFEFRSNVQDPDRWLVEYAGGHPTASGQTITERTAVQISGVYRAVNLVSNGLATSPLTLFEKLPDDSRRELPDHPLSKVLKRPNEEMTAITFRATVQAHLLLWGNGYAEIERNGAGQVVALWPLRPDRTFPRRINDKGPLIYVVRASGGQEVILQPEDVLHVMGYSYDGLRGLSTVALHRETLGLSTATMDYGARFFGNDARPGGILTASKPMRKEARDRLKSSWEEGHRGGANAFGTAVLEDGVTWTAMGMPNEDAQFLQTRIFQLSEIARMFGVPLHMLAELSHATFSNIEHQSIEYVRDGIVPWGCRWEEEIERKLLLPGEQDRLYVDHNYAALMRGDMDSRFKAYDTAWKDGWYNADDVMKLENRSPLPNGQGQTYFVPVTQQPIDRALNPPEPPLQAPGSGPSSGNEPPPKPPEKNGAPKSKAQKDAAQKAAGAQRMQIARAFSGALEVVGERLNRKETAALERIFGGYKTAEVRSAERTHFFDGHGEYVREAFEPILLHLWGSVDTLAGRLPQAGKIDPEFVRKYAEGLAHRYVEAARAQLTAAEKIPSWCAGMESRSHSEAMRAGNAFALAIFKAAGVKEIAWVAPDDGTFCCTSCFPALTRTIAPGQDFFEGFQHPPLHTGCECQIIAVT